MYDQTTGGIYYDRDGNGSTYGHVFLGVVPPGTVLTASDFVLL